MQLFLSFNYCADLEILLISFLFNCDKVFLSRLFGGLSLLPNESITRFMSKLKTFIQVQLDCNEKHNGNSKSEIPGIFR